eukprot:g59972.t1
MLEAVRKDLKAAATDKKSEATKRKEKRKERQLVLKGEAKRLVIDLVRDGTQEFGQQPDVMWKRLKDRQEVTRGMSVEVPAKEWGWNWAKKTYGPEWKSKKLQPAHFVRFEGKETENEVERMLDTEIPTEWAVPERKLDHIDLRYEYVITMILVAMPPKKKEANNPDDQELAAHVALMNVDFAPVAVAPAPVAVAPAPVAVAPAPVAVAPAPVAAARAHIPPELGGVRGEDEKKERKGGRKKGTPNEVKQYGNYFIKVTVATGTATVSRNHSADSIQVSLWGFKSQPKVIELFVVKFKDDKIILCRKWDNIGLLAKHFNQAIKTVYSAEFV